MEEKRERFEAKPISLHESSWLGRGPKDLSDSTSRRRVVGAMPDTVVVGQVECGMVRDKRIELSLDSAASLCDFLSKNLGDLLREVPVECDLTRWENGRTLRIVAEQYKQFGYVCNLRVFLERAGRGEVPCEGVALNLQEVCSLVSLLPGAVEEAVHPRQRKGVRDLAEAAWQFVAIGTLGPDLTSLKLARLYLEAHCDEEGPSAAAKPASASPHYLAAMLAAKFLRRSAALFANTLKKFAERGGMSEGDMEVVRAQLGEARKNFPLGEEVEVAGEEEEEEEEDEAPLKKKSA